MENHRFYNFNEMIESVFSSMEHSRTGEYERLLYPDDEDEFIFWIDTFIQDELFEFLEDASMNPVTRYSLSDVLKIMCHSRWLAKIYIARHWKGKKSPKKKKNGFWKSLFKK